MSELVGNPKDRFSHATAQVIITHCMIADSDLDDFEELSENNIFDDLDDSDSDTDTPKKKKLKSPKKGISVAPSCSISMLLVLVSASVLFSPSMFQVT